jgi:phosphosulfolactate synthase (CoM biosynthesis protein A)
MKASRFLQQCGWMMIVLGGSYMGTAHAETSSEQAELVALTNAWIDAEVHRDQAVLERILDERFLATYASGKTIDRSAFIDAIMRSNLEPFTVVNQVIDIHGDTALVIDASESGKTKFTWVAVRKEGRWRVISETFSHVTGPEE